MGQISPSEKKVPKKSLIKLEKEQDRKKRIGLGLPVIKVRRQIPWGYEADPNNPVMCLPSEKAFACLIQAEKYLKSSSYMEVSQWLKSCGFPVSPWGLYLIFKDRPPLVNKALPLEERMKLL